MNNYTYTYVGICPVDNEFITYNLDIETTETIHVEHIVTYTKIVSSKLHEQQADELFNKFGGKQTMVAVHQGVKIVTTRGAV